MPIRIPVPAGRAKLTTQLRVLYDKYSVGQNVQGLEHADWPIWLQQNGFKIGPDNLVIPVGDNDVEKMIQQYSTQ